MSILLIGGGSLLLFLAKAFVARGFRVVLINDDAAECRRLAERLDCRVIEGDGTDPSVQEAAEAASVDIVVALTRHDHDNLAACQVAKLLFGVPRTCALINDPDHAVLFQRLGVNVAVSLVDLVSSTIEQVASPEQVVSRLPAAGGRVSVVEVVLQPESAACGRTLADIELPMESVVATVVRGDDVLVPRGSTLLRAGDRMVMVTKSDSRDRILGLLQNS